MATLEQIAAASAGCAMDADCVIAWGGGCNSLGCELPVGDAAAAERIAELVNAYEDADCGCPNGCTPCTCGVAESVRCDEGRCELVFE